MKVNKAKCRCERFLDQCRAQARDMVIRGGIEAHMQLLACWNAALLDPGTDPAMRLRLIFAVQGLNEALASAADLIEERLEGLERTIEGGNGEAAP